ncbi:hypothetical protein [Roseivirga sp. E12]|uniref:hypothetical protein n=1 Tax=Roseivirga sp. E12 TaxID=2819237 RepID=UPI001ABC11D8|nr:hypothetical protein [Roseivirga sp. E12]MBO3697681.1 hypothetical protein [Roseivirga sp. E12]
MTGLGFLDLVIGIIFIYFLLSIVVSILLEIRSKSLSLRANNLEAWLKDTFAKEGLSEKLLEHDLIKTLVKKGRKPAYIPDQNFVDALFDIVNQEEGNKLTYTVDEIKGAFEKSQLLPNDLKRNILQQISEAETKAQSFIKAKKDEVIDELLEVKKGVGDWFDNCMIRVGGTYRNMQQKWLLLFSFTVVLLFNADTITLSKYLYNNKDVRDALVEQASRSTQDSLTVAFYQQIMESSTAAQNTDSVVIGQDGMVLINEIKGSVSNLKQVNAELEALSLPLGWESFVLSFNDMKKEGGFWNFVLLFLMKIVGLTITGFAVSMGSPFWFDILNKLVNLKGTGGKPAAKK